MSIQSEKTPINSIFLSYALKIIFRRTEEHVRQEAGGVKEESEERQEEPAAARTESIYFGRLANEAMEFPRRKC